MPAQTGKSRATKAGARRQAPKVPLTRMLVVDALRTWVIPTVATAIGLVVFVVYNLGLVDEALAVTVVGTLALVVILFLGLRGFSEQAVSPALGGVLIGFTALWTITTFYPFYRARNPGTPVFSAQLSRAGGPVTLPLRDKPGHYKLIVSGHFLPAEGRQNRTATYRIALGHDGSTDRILEGVFDEEWHSQRIGAGRRSSLVPVKSQTTQVLATVDDPEGRDLTLALTDLSPGVGDSVAVNLFAEPVPMSLLFALAILTVIGALFIDASRPKGVNEGLMGTLTVATLVSIGVFRASSSVAPGFPQLIIAALVGTLAGAVGGSLLWRLTLQIRKRVPALR
jgi:hypothetical protein